jgi:hypothetical protein
VAAGGSTDAVIWYENDGGLSEINWTEHPIDLDFDGGNVVYVEDVDGDGDMDVAVTGYTSSTVVWYENGGGIPIAWNKHTIDPYLGGAAGCYIADMDGDDSMDVIATGHDADSVVWYKNNGGVPITWTKMTIDPDLDGANEIDIADMDNDSDLDVVAVGYYADAVVWYENPGWEKHIIDDTLEGAWSVEIADMANDLDILAAGRDGDDVVWYENPTWHKHYIDTNLAAANHIRAADIDKDGALDVIFTGWEPTNSIFWYKNIITDVGHEANVVPDEYSLSQNYPNPFNPSTTIEFALPHAGYVNLKVYNVLGEQVATLAEGDHAAGTFKTLWDASGLPSGVYFYRLTAREYVQTKKMVLMK